MIKENHITEKERLGNHIRLLREDISSFDYEKESISQQELADKNIGLTKNLIGTIERAEANPTLDKIILLAKALNFKTFTLFGLEINVEKFVREWEAEKESKNSK